MSKQSVVQTATQLTPIFLCLSDRDPQTGEVIDLLRDGGSGGQRKTVIDAEYVEV